MCVCVIGFLRGFTSLSSKARPRQKARSCAEALSVSQGAHANHVVLYRLDIQVASSGSAPYLVTSEARGSLEYVHSSRSWHGSVQRRSINPARQSAQLTDMARCYNKAFKAKRPQQAARPPPPRSEPKQQRAS